MTERFPGIRRRTRPEVLAPAGNLDTLKTAFDFGADAVYFGGQEFGMRSAPKNFTLSDIAEAVSYAHERGGRVFVTCNILPTSAEVTSMNEYMRELGQIGVDALIVTDIGVLMAAREVAPDTEIHVSTQAGVTNYQAANALAQLGATRVVLARELSLADIRELRAHTSPELEIEAFVHGSMCMAFSGRCLISQHTTGRDANHGDCAQSCRYKYHVVEERRPGQFIPVEITDQGTFLFNSNDMNTISHIDEILDAGVTSLKIEGRAKSAYYVAAMANAYKSAVNEYMVQRGFEGADGTALVPFHDQVHRPDVGARPATAVAFSPWLAEEPNKVTHRAYSTGFYYPDRPAGEEIHKGGYINEWLLAGIVTKYDAVEGRVYLHAKNKLAPGKNMEILFPGSAPVALTVPSEGLQDAEGNTVAEINHPAHEFSMPCAVPVPQGAMIRVHARLHHAG
ncbi:peptidase U32 family protein [Trueperella pecoris]|uniref:peptidase U32 family protein n=1 Tax=Trueperella pecoris TaxID=2733571 RepID=UPI00186BA5C4|nr:U32 family peptidase [Trueperella pecoris]QOQ38652.1 U32 family peptidase [Trueperella pecoris]